MEELLLKETHNVETLTLEINTLKEPLKTKDLKIVESNDKSRESNFITTNLKESVRNCSVRKETIECTKCNAVITTDETMGEHILKNHTVKCHRCDKAFISEQQLGLHRKYDHYPNKTGVSCQKCNFFFSTKHDFDKHLSDLQHNEEEKNNHYNETDDNEETDEDEEYLDSCGLCGIVLYSYEEVDDHQSNYLCCDKCSVCFHNEFQWEKHENCDRY